MAAKRWNVEIDGIEHTIEFKKGFRAKLIVDGKEEILKSQNWAVFVIDEVIDLGSKDVRLVVIGNKVDLAVDGIYLNSREPYVPIESLHKSTWIFAAISALPIIVFGGGALNAVIAIFGATFCIINSINPKRSAATKLILNIVITISTWAIDILVLGLVAGLLR